MSCYVLLSHISHHLEGIINSDREERTECGAAGVTRMLFVSAGRKNKGKWFFNLLANNKNYDVVAYKYVYNI